MNSHRGTQVINNKHKLQSILEGDKYYGKQKKNRVRYIWIQGCRESGINFKWESQGRSHGEVEI